MKQKNTLRNSVLKCNKGVMLIAALSVIGIFLTLAGGLASLGVYEYRLYLRKVSKTQALHIAEAGVNYYRWHLAHAETDFFDGTGSGPGPYEHTYISPQGDLTGVFSLEITPPETGSTIATIKSTGWTDDFPNIKRVVEVRYGIPSFSTYSVVVNSNVRFGSGTEIFGPLHSNGGIRFDGVAHNLVSSAVTCYDDPDTDPPVDPCEQPGVWTSQANPEDVFLSGTDFPVPAVDFDGITADLAAIKADAQSEGFYLSYRNRGYRLHFNTDGTFDVYEVDSLTSKGWIYEGDGNWEWTSYDIQNETLDSSSNAIPANGLIFVEADVWVDGIVDGRVTVASGRFPENPNQYTNITIVNDIVCESHDGSDVIGLMAQNHVQIGYYCEDNLEIEAAILAQNGRFYRPYYYYYETPSPGAYNLRDTITITGSLAMSDRYGLHWCCPDSGYWTRNINYNSSLVYSPPPSFPTTGEYAFISWEEN
ncbi:hypothetical protein HOD96_02875 [Candidatus Falkowbacteria bacterium]|jgi:hypothetical protein|nr:hypothetical protein [Candidatus Falkowbacteria bacterium]